MLINNRVNQICLLIDANIKASLFYCALYHFPLKIPLFSDYYYMLGILHTGFHITKKSLISILNKIRNKTTYNRSSWSRGSVPSSHARGQQF